jgi:hypothetical protein
MDEDVVISSEVSSGTAILRVTCGPGAARRTNLFEHLTTEFESAFRTALSKACAKPPRCGVVINAEYEFDDQSLIRAIIALWDVASREDGRVFVVGYPQRTASGQRLPMPPFLPGFALARDVASGIRWASRSKQDLEGGDNWNREPGVSRGRSLIPGERFLEELPETNDQDRERDSETNDG